MPTPGTYCKAYPAYRFRAFPGWLEKCSALRAPHDDSGGDNKAESSIEYFYLHDNYTVTAGIYLDENIAFDDVTPEWRDFCEAQLEFQIPEDVKHDLVDEVANAPA